MSYIENINYYNDPRNCESDETPILYLNNEEIELPTTWTVCSTCGGEGKHVNPAIDCGGLSSDDFYEDPDFADDYFSGVHDVTCNHCHGRTTVRAVDWDALTPEIREAYQEQLQDEADDRAYEAAERAMGA